MSGSKTELLQETVRSPLRPKDAPHLIETQKRPVLSRARGGRRAILGLPSTSTGIRWPQHHLLSSGWWKRTVASQPGTPVSAFLAGIKTPMP